MRAATRPGQGPAPGRYRWQFGHQNLTRSWPGGPASPRLIRVPQRRHGRPARPYTQFSRPGLASPVVTCQSPGLAGAADGEICRRDRAPGEPAKDSGRGAADDNRFICCHCRGVGMGSTPTRCLYQNRNLIYQPGIQGRQDAGKHQVNELRRQWLCK